MEGEKILSRFSPKYKEKINLNPMYRTIYELLVSGVDEYSLIESLLEANENWAIALTKMQEENPPKYFITKEDYDRAKRN